MSCNSSPCTAPESLRDSSSCTRCICVRSSRCGPKATWSGAAACQVRSGSRSSNSSSTTCWPVAARVRVPRARPPLVAGWATSVAKLDPTSGPLIGDVQGDLHNWQGPHLGVADLQLRSELRLTAELGAFVGQVQGVDGMLFIVQVTDL